MSQNLQEINEFNFIGMNDKYPSHLLTRGQFTNLENVLVGDNKIAKRPGTTASTSLGAHDILGGGALEPSNSGTKSMIACLNGSSFAQLYRSTNFNTWSAIGSANITKDNPMTFVQANDFLFGFNTTDVVQVDSSGTVTHNPSGIPKGAIAYWYHNYLFVTGVPGFPNRVYFSNLGDPATFTSTDFIDINANDGDFTIGFAPLNDELMIFKHNSIWSIDGFSGSTFTATTINGQNTNNRNIGYGAVAGGGIVPVGKNIYYLSFLGGTPHIRMMTMTAFGKIWDQGIQSFDIEGTLNGLNKDQLSKVKGVYDGKYCYWAVPDAASTSNNTVLVFYPDLQIRGPLGVSRSWVKWTGINPSSFFISTLSGHARVYFTDATTTGFVFVVDPSVATDNGVNISMDVKTRDFMLDSTGARKSKYKYVYLQYKSGLSGTLGVNARIDRDIAFTNEKNLSLGGSSPGLGPTGTFTIGVSLLGGALIAKSRVNLAQATGTLLGLQFTEATNSQCEIYNFDIFGFKRALRED